MKHRKLHILLAALICAIIVPGCTFKVGGMKKEESPMPDGAAAPTKIHFALNRRVDGCRTRLIRNGVVIFKVEGVELTYYDDGKESDRSRAYYRVEVIGPRHDRGMHEDPTMPETELFVNPIFVTFN